VITAATRVAAVIGSPVAHSLSPALHNAGFAALGVDWVYTAFDVAAGGTEAALAAMSTLGIGGLSVTMPHKEAAADLVDELDPAAAALRSVNTIVLLGNGRLKGYSTDGAGFVASLAANDVDLRAQRVCVVGGGGAARAIADAVARAGAADVAVVNRSPDRAAAAAALAGDVGRVGTPVDIGAADVVVNATSVGMGSSETPWDVALIRSGQVVADIVYHPRSTALLVAAEQRGARTVEGLGMLVHQAILQQQLWTGLAPDSAVMWLAAERELASSGR
jgi:shikimate dehydrogenase